ncbi:unnamed protein product [Rotaria sordida]|uniref:Uncharacterized protein n=2 Tax=Rotaria sordida TaxID=392033 RepID=A0A820LZZ9_9BILA|nr:unnamed protein product [Rotaria sordida]
MIDIIDQLKNLDNITFTLDEFSEDEDTDFFLKKLSFRWFENNSYRLAINHFTFRQGEEFSYIQISIGGRKTEKYSKS